MQQPTIQVRTRWVLMDVHHIRNGTRTMADVIFNHRKLQQPPPHTIKHPSQWLYVAIRLMAHMGAYTPDDRNQLLWRWYDRAALRIREPLIRHNIWTHDPASPGAAQPRQSHGAPAPQSPTAQGPLRQVASTSH